MHPEIEATQPHEIRHVHMVDGRTMESFLVSDHKFASLGRITWPSSRTLRAINEDTVLNESDALHSERNFETQAVRRRSAAKKNLCGAPVTRLCGNIQCRHLVPASKSVPSAACVQ